jgi:hypothetical protein
MLLFDSAIDLLKKFHANLGSDHTVAIEISQDIKCLIVRIGRLYDDSHFVLREAITFDEITQSNLPDDFMVERICDKFSHEYKSALEAKGKA